MREILFRGKRTDNGEWEYGDLWCNPYGKRVVCIVSPINDQGTTGGNEVDPETVGQYTGLTDKNGRKIFEGDIVNFYNGDGEFSPYEVRWQDSGFSVLMNGDHDLFDVLDDFFSRHCEIIGNIYDNPELLEVKQND